MSTLYGLLAAALAIGVGGARLFALLAPSRWQRRLDPRLLAALLAGSACLPLFAGVSAAMWLHGAVGPLSLTLTQILLLAGLQIPLPALPRRALLVGAGAALLFYTLALGVGSFDPYGSAYSGLWPLLVTLAIGGWLWQQRQYLWLFVLGLDLAAYGGGLCANLWNALFDPALVAFALFVLIRHLLPRRQAR